MKRTPDEIVEIAFAVFIAFNLLVAASFLVALTVKIWQGVLS